MKRYKISVLPGDGIGPEVVEAAIQVLKTIEKRFSIEFDFVYNLIGGISIDTNGVPVSDNVVAEALASDAVLLGAVGGPKWDNLPSYLRPERALLRLRKELGLYINLRPSKVTGTLSSASPLKPEVVRGTDIMVVRELTGGIYYGEPKEITQLDNEERAVDSMVYTTSEIERIAHAAFKTARKRKHKVTSVDKANILATSQLWRKTVNEIHVHYPDVVLEHMLVDNCAMQLIRNPLQFDVILTENMFGDILSDETAMLTGSIGMLPSASLGVSNALYEPVHGSAPDIAGKDLANPIATIASVGMMLRYSFNEITVADSIDASIESVLQEGYACADMQTENKKIVGTKGMGNLIVKAMYTF